MSIRLGIGLDKHFFRAQLGSALEVDGVDCLACAQSDHSANTAIDGRINHVFAAYDIGLNCLKWVLFAGRHLFESGRMHHDSHIRKGALQPLSIAHIPEQIPQTGMIESRARISCCFNSSRLKRSIF